MDERARLSQPLQLNAGSAVTDERDDVHLLRLYFTSHSTALMGSLVVPGLSLGILGALVIVSAWVLIYIYVRWANNSYDEKIAQLTKGMNTSLGNLIHWRSLSSCYSLPALGITYWAARRTKAQSSSTLPGG